MSTVTPSQVDGQSPVPDVWRPTLSAIVAAFAQGDFQPRHLPGLAPISDDTATQMRDYIADYGQVTLTGLTPDTWSSSVAQRWGKAWRILLDLRTEEEGRSDLCLQLHVREADGGYRFEVLGIYVP